MRRLGRAILWIFACVGLFAVAGVVGAVIMLQGVRAPKVELPDRMILTLDLNEGIVEQEPTGPLAMLRTTGPLSIRAVLDALEKARDDDRVAGVTVRLGTSAVGVAAAQEIRDAVTRFRESGKFAVTYADSFGMRLNATLEYYLASAFEEIWMQPSGDVAMTGLAVEIPFFAETFEKVGLEPKIAQRMEYKSMAETFTRTGLSDPARENLQRLVDSWFEQIVAGIAAGRGLSEERVRDLVDSSPLLSNEAVEAKLVDRLGYWQQFVEAAQERAGEGFELTGIRRYVAAGDRPHSAGPTVALVHGIGAIVSGDGRRGDPFDDTPYFAAERVARAIYDATEDEEVKALLLRIDSPGGSYLASDTVWAAIRHAREQGKPVVISMAGLAASGGYFVAMAADRIVALPGTVTGSIGVYGGKFVAEELMEKLGVHWQTLKVGAHADMWSMVRDYPPGAEERLTASLDFVYRDFTEKLAEARNLSAEEVDAVARGRVWTGADAAKSGLVDRLGGLDTAVLAVKESLGLEPEESINLQPFPKPRSLFDMLYDLATGDSTDAVEVLARTFFPRSRFSFPLEREMVPLAREIGEMGLPVGRLYMPPIRLKR